MHLGASTLGRSNLSATYKPQAERVEPPQLQAGMPTALSATMQKGQACGHGFAHNSCCVEARNTGLYPRNLGNLQNQSLRENNQKIGRQASWVSPSSLDQGGDPAYERTGSKPPFLKHLAFGEGMVTEPELPTSSQMLTSMSAEGHLVLLADSFNQDSLKSIELGKRACKTKLSTKGAKQEDPNLACSLTAYKQKQQTREEQKQLDQARLQEGQLRRDLQQDENKQNNLGSSSLGTNNQSLEPACNNSSLGNNSLGIGDQQECTESLERQPLAFQRSSLSIWKILIDTGAELSVAPWDFAAEIQLSPLTQDLQLRVANGRAIHIFGLRTVQLLTQGFSFCITFVIADVERPLLGFGSLLHSNLSLQLNNLGHHLGNIAGEKIQLEQRGLQLYLSACPTHVGLTPCNRASLLNDSLLPKANLLPIEKKQLRKEVSNQGGAVGSSLPLRSLDEHRQHRTKTAIGQQALPKARPKHKKVGKTKTSKLELEKTDFIEKMQLALLEQEDPRASLDPDTGKQLSLRIILIFSLMNKWQLKTTRIQPAWPQEVTKTKLRELV